MSELEVNLLTVELSFASAIFNINQLIENHKLTDRQLDFILMIRTELNAYLDEYTKTEKTIH